jgi:hypothetical protein
MTVSTDATVELEPNSVAARPNRPWLTPVALIVGATLTIAWVAVLGWGAAALLHLALF